MQPGCLMHPTPLARPSRHCPTYSVPSGHIWHRRCEENQSQTIKPDNAATEHHCYCCITTTTPPTPPRPLLLLLLPLLLLLLLLLLRLLLLLFLSPGLATGGETPSARAFVRPRLLRVPESHYTHPPSLGQTRGDNMRTRKGSNKNN